MTSDFIDIHEIENIFSKECELYYFTKNKQAFQLILGNLKSIPLFCKQSTTIINNENNENMTTNKEKIINAVYSFGEKSFLTTNKVYISNKEIELPKIDVDDKLIKLIVNDNKTSAFLLTEKGQLFIYGENQYGILGIGKSGYVYSKFTKHVIQKEIKNKIIDLKCGYLFSVLRCENGDCYGSGYNYYVNIGIIGPNTGELNKFTLLEQLKGKVKQHDCGYFHTAYLTFDGEVYITGKQDNGQFGKKFPSVFSHVDCTSLQKIELNSITKFKSLICGNYSTTLLSEKNTIFYNGKVNQNNNLYNNNNNDKKLPLKTISEHFIEIDCNLDKFIGNYGFEKFEFIEIGLQFNLINQQLRGIILLKDLFGKSNKNLIYFKNNLFKMIDKYILSDLYFLF
ncbi:hypothetical protein ABK040_007060 [Willaertia magna]